jgi:hypothetical protein
MQWDPLLAHAVQGARPSRGVGGPGQARGAPCAAGPRPQVGTPTRPHQHLESYPDCPTRREAPASHRLIRHARRQNRLTWGRQVIRMSTPPKRCSEPSAPHSVATPWDRTTAQIEIAAASHEHLVAKRVARDSPSVIRVAAARHFSPVSRRQSHLRPVPGSSGAR